MAFKQINAEAGMNSYTSSTNPVRVEIDAYLVTNDGQKVTIELSGLEMVPMEKLMLERHLIDLGLEEDDANYLGEQFYRIVENHLLAKAIAKRMRRV